MDTRQKIIDLNEAVTELARNNWTVVPGLFDPLTATQAVRIAALAEATRKLAVFVIDTEQTLLPAEARAALVAGLRSVDLVAIAQPNEWRHCLADCTNVRIVEDAEGEAKRSADFVKFVIRRQNSANGAKS